MREPGLDWGHMQEVIVVGSHTSAYFMDPASAVARRPTILGLIPFCEMGEES